MDKSSPEVVKLLPLWKAEPLGDGRHGIFLSSHELKAQDSDSRDEELIFCIVRQPYFGYLENITTGWVIKSVCLDHSLASNEKMSLSLCSCRWFCTTALLSDGAEQENYCVCHQPRQGVSLRQPGVQRVGSFGEHRAVSHVRATSTAQIFHGILNEQCSLHCAWPCLYRLEFSWSTVELSQPEYSVCEEQGTVSLDIIRKGNLAESSYITVKVTSY